MNNVIFERENGKFELLSPKGYRSYGFFDSYPLAKAEYIRLLFDPSVRYFTNEG